MKLVMQTRLLGVFAEEIRSYMVGSGSVRKCGRSRRFEGEYMIKPMERKKKHDSDRYFH